MKRVLLCMAMVHIALSSCHIEKKYQAYIQTLYNAEVALDTTTSPIHFICDISETFSTAATVKASNSFKNENPTYECKLNPRVPFEIFSRQFQKSADATGLSNSLANKRLEIHLLSSPGAFKYVQLGRVTNIYPNFNKLHFTYSLYNGITKVRKGEVVLEDNEDAAGDPFSRWKPLTKAYLYRYEYRLKALTHQSILRLNKEIQHG